MKRKERKNVDNKGKICIEPGCRFHAVAKGYCINCYQRKRYRRKEK